MVVCLLDGKFEWLFYIDGVYLLGVYLKEI